jgi:hypothetical protein
VLIAGGYLSYSTSVQSSPTVPGVQIQTDNPDASTAAVTPQKGAMLLIATAVIGGSLVVVGGGLAWIFWMLNRQVTKVKQEPDTGFDFSLNPAAPNSIGAALTHRPTVTIAVVVVALVALSAFIAAVFGVFSPK